MNSAYHGASLSACWMTSTLLTSVGLGITIPLRRSKLSPCECGLHCPRPLEKFISLFPGEGTTTSTEDQLWSGLTARSSRPEFSIAIPSLEDPLSRDLSSSPSTQLLRSSPRDGGSPWIVQGRSSSRRRVPHQKEKALALSAFKVPPSRF